MRTAILVIVAVTMACIPRAVFPVSDRESLIPNDWTGNMELDAEVLRAMQVAANDYFPPQPPWAWLFEDEVDRCLWSQNSLEYDVIVTRNVIFVRLSVEPSLCGMVSAISDNGARYAIRRADGRIVRRLMWFEPDDPEPWDAQSPDPPPPPAPTLPPATASPVPISREMRPPPL